MKALLVVALLSGCAVFDAPPAPELKRSTFHLFVQEGDLPPNVNGMATYYETLRVCAITLREYPKCLLHEIRHCTEGDWHPTDVPNDEDC